MKRLNIKTLLLTSIFSVLMLLMVTCKKSETKTNEPPTAPTGLTAVVHDNHIRLSWDSSNNAKYYVITNTFYVRDNNNNICSDISGIFLGFSASNYYIDLYPFDSINHYRISAVNQYGSSSISEISCNYWIDNPNMWFYPNPTKDTIILKGEGTLFVKDDRIGDTIDEFNLYGVDTYDMGQYGDGVYLLICHGESNETVRRVVVDHECGYSVK